MIEKTEEDMTKFRVDVLEQLATAKMDNVGFLQGVIYALDWMKTKNEEKPDEG